MRMCRPAVQSIIIKFQDYCWLCPSTMEVSVGTSCETADLKCLLCFEKALIKIPKHVYCVLLVGMFPDLEIESAEKTLQERTYRLVG